MYVGLRWVVGIGGPLVLAFLTLRTLESKATQAATGILYVVVIVTFIGEATGMMLSLGGGVPH